MPRRPPCTSSARPSPGPPPELVSGTTVRAKGRPCTSPSTSSPTRPVRDLLADHGAADLITMTSEGLVATLLPFEYDPDAGEHGALIGHMARGRVVRGDRSAPRG
ncbi:FMN-binding negative transcriptional regulator [Streptomyces coeruleorubidus]|uniref:FMN-binding negative transcriptional regulator n=1 Tax=Streptomyces coeruleorubidus TaxID=116188 RepID=UPI0038211CA2